MNQREAFNETLGLAINRDYINNKLAHDDTDMAHFLEMQRKIDKAFEGGMEEYFTDAKLGRWLGYLQGVLVANKCLTLEECKEINRRWA